MSTRARWRRNSGVALLSPLGSRPSAASSAASAGRRTGGQRLLDGARPDRRRGHVHQRDPDAAVDPRRRHADDRPVLGAPHELLVGVAAGRLRHPDLDQDLVGGEGGLQEPAKNSVAGISRSPAGPRATSVPPRASTAAGQVRGRIGVGDRAADRARGGGPGGHRSARPPWPAAAPCADRHGVVLDVVVAGQRTDGHVVALVADVGELASRPMSTSTLGVARRSFMSGQQRVAAGQQLGLVAVLGEHGRAPRRPSPPGRSRTRPGSPGPLAARAGRVEHRRHDVVVAGAAAQVALEPLAHLGARRDRGSRATSETAAITMPGVQ